MTDTTTKSAATPIKAVAGPSLSKRKAHLPAPAKAAVAQKAAPSTKPVVAAKSQAGKAPPKPPVAAKATKAKKPKMIRDSMTMPKAEYAVLDVLKLRAAQLASPVKKTELLRAGIKALANMSDAGFLVALKAVPSLKTGRPSKS